jgi:probable blue pigment (indigoidine) exporter
MQVIAAYLCVLLVWSTTPLGIHFSNSSLTFSTAIALRMLLGFACCYALLRVTGERLFQQRSDRVLYAASAVGLFPNMLLVYWAAQYIPSGLMSVIMGIYPFFVGIFSTLILKEKTFTFVRVMALVFAIIGLAIIQFEQMNVGQEAVAGVLVMVLVCVIWGFSSVMVKKLGADVGALRQGTGSLAVALPFFMLSWWFLDGQIPHTIDQKSLFGVAYLVIIGTVLSHTLWFFVLRECSVISVAIIPLMTPLLAITWGVLFAGESFGVGTLLGALIILLALGLYQNLFVRAVIQLSVWTQMWRQSRKRSRHVNSVPAADGPST